MFLALCTRRRWLKLNEVPKSPIKKRVVRQQRGWAVVDDTGLTFGVFDGLYNVAMTRKDANNFLDFDWKIVPCTITYTLPK